MFTNTLTAAGMVAAVKTYAKDAGQAYDDYCKHPSTDMYWGERIVDRTEYIKLKMGELFDSAYPNIAALVEKQLKERCSDTRHHGGMRARFFVDGGLKQGLYPDSSSLVNAYYGLFELCGLEVDGDLSYSTQLKKLDTILETWHFEDKVRDLI